MGILISLAVLSVLIIVHEFGHFLVARYFKVQVDEFGLGLPILITKPIYKKKIGKTVYSLYPMLLGGFVRMKGQDDFDLSKKSDDIDSYRSKTPWQKIAILLAGPFANFLLAFILYIIIALIGVQKLAPTVGAIQPNSAAMEAGIKPNDKLLSINNQPIKSWNDISKIVETSQGVLNIQIQRDRKIVYLQLVPKMSETQNIFKEKIQKKLIGISPNGDLITLKFNTFSEIIKYAFEETLMATTLIIQSIQKLIQGIIPADQMGGIVSIVQVTSEASTVGIVALLTLAALISVNLGILNLLPIPALDGGHIMFNLYEIIFKRPPSENAFYRLTVAGWIFLLSLMVFATYNDIVRLIGGNQW